MGGSGGNVGETYEQIKTWATHESAHPDNDLNYLTHSRRLFRFAAPPLFYAARLPQRPAVISHGAADRRGEKFRRGARRRLTSRDFCRVTESRIKTKKQKIKTSPGAP